MTYLDARARALELFEPPFHHMNGYIYDKNGVVADRCGEVLRVRGWGKISYEKDAGKMQDALGDLIADALTAYWSSGGGR